MPSPLRHGRLDRLRSFIVLAEELHFGRAARRLNLSQPALTLQVQALEAEIGTPLVARGKRHSELTQAGHAFLREARIALRHLELAASRAKEAAIGGTGRITVGFCHDYHYGLLPRVLSRFSRQHPDVSVEARLELSQALARSVTDHALDIAFISAPLEREARNLRRLDLPPTRLVALLPAAHPLARRRRISLAMLAGERFVLPPLIGWTGFYRQLARLFEEAGFVPDVALEVLDTTLLTNVVAGGAGIGLASVGSVPERAAGVAYVDLAGGSAATALAAIWRADDRSAVVGNFIAVLRREVSARRGRLLRA